MKKRLLSTLLIVAMLASLTTVFTVSASEDIEPSEEYEIVTDFPDTVPVGEYKIIEALPEEEPAEEDEVIMALSEEEPEEEEEEPSQSSAVLYAASADRKNWVSFSPNDTVKAISVADINYLSTNGNTLFAAEYVSDTSRGIDKVYFYRSSSNTATTNASLLVASLDNLEATATGTSAGNMTYDIAYNYSNGYMYYLRRTSSFTQPRLFYAAASSANNNLTITPAATNGTAGGVFYNHDGTEQLTGQMLALAIDASGNAYGLYRTTDGDAHLYSIALQNSFTLGTILCTYIGDTNFDTYDGTQSMVFDHASGTLYWAQYYDGVGHLVELNTTTGAGTLLRDTDGNIAGLFVGPALEPYEISFAASAGGTITGGENSVAVERGDAINKNDVPNPEADAGYFFAGWSSSAGGWYLNPADATIKASATFTAQFSEIDTEFDAAINAAGSDLHFSQVGTYPWAVIQVNSERNGEEFVKSTNSAWGVSPIVRLSDNMTSGSSTLETMRTYGIFPDFFAAYFKSFEYNTSSTVTTVATLNAGDIVSFDYLVNALYGSATTRDYLYFRVNGVQVGQYYTSGTRGNIDTWETGEYTIPEDGVYLLEWTFTRPAGNTTMSMFADAAFLDNVYVGAKADYPVESISVAAANSVYVGNFIEIPYTINPDYATNATVTWSSSNPSVATVSDKGRVKGVSAGTADITVTTSNGKTATCTVTVSDGARPVRFYAFDLHTDVMAWVTFSSDNPSDYTVIAKLPTDARVRAAEYAGDEDGSGYVYGYLSDGTFFKTKLDALGTYESLGSISASRVVYDMAYDYSTDTMYALSNMQDVLQMRALYKVNLSTGELTLVSTIDSLGIDIWTLAITTQGSAYGVSHSEYHNASFLWEINLSNGKATRLNTNGTGTLLMFVQSMTYDHNTGRMFWAQFHYGPYDENFTAGLYEVNPETGKAAKLGTLNNNVGEYAGLMVVRNATVTGYYSDKKDTPLTTGVSVGVGTEGAAALAALPASGYAKLSDGGYELVTISWDWAEGMPNTGHQLNAIYDVVGTIMGGTFAYGDTIDGTIRFSERAQAPVISAQPAGTSVTVGGSVTLNVTASAPDGGTLSYQWYKNGSNSSTDGTVISGATSSTYSPDTSAAGTTYYYVVVTNALSNTKTSVTSAVAAVTVSEESGGNTGNTSGGNTSGGNTGNTSDDTSITVATEGDTVIGQIAVTPSTTTVGGVVTSTASVTTTAVANALAAAVKQSSDTGAIVVEIKVDVAKNAQAATLELTESSIAAIAKKNAILLIDVGIAKVTFDAKALETMAGAAGESKVSISISTVDATALTEEAQKIVESHPVFDIRIMSGETTISDLNGGWAKISVPYSPSAEELKNPDAIVVYYISASGELEYAPGRYNAKTGMVEFETGHFSQYAVAFNLITYPDTPVWAKEAVTFTAARGIVSYTGSFEPDELVTRGEFLIALMKAYAIDVSGPKDEYAFADIAKDSELYAYATVAREMGITDGIDGVRFDPNSVIERQQIAAFFIKALNAMDKLPAVDTGRTLSDYADGNVVAAWAAPYVETAVKTGLINSTSRTEWVVDPVLMVTRSQMAQLIYNLFV